MYRMTARSIALISPMRQSFAALTKASEFAAQIIEKYSGTEPFPFSGETLVYFNAIREHLEQEQKLRGDTTYILKLVIIRRLMLEGKLGDPTVTRLFLKTVSGSIERSLHYLRVSDNNAYTRMTAALAYINSVEDLSENILLSEVHEGATIYRYSVVDINTLADRFFGGNSESYAYSGVYAYGETPAFVYKKETVAGESVSVPATPANPNVLSDNVVNDIISGTAVGAGGDNYSYNSENLTYKTDVSEITGDTSVQNIRNIAETTVFAPVTNAADNPTAAQQTVIKAGDSNYSYSSENLTYKTDVSEITGDTSVQNIRNIAETTVSAPVTNVADNPTAAPQTVKNAGDSNYSYSSEKLTYKTDVSEITGDTSVQNIRNIAETTVSAPVTNTAGRSAAPQTVINAGDSNYIYSSENLTYKTDVSEITGETSVQNIRNIAETTVSAPVTNATDNPTAAQQTVIKAGDSNYSYNSENLTYKTDVSEITGDTSVQNIRSIAETTVSAPVTNTAGNPTEALQTVVNAGDSNYSYNSENLTYKTDVSEITGDTSVQNVRNIAETTVSAPVTNAADNPTAAQQTVINAGDSNYSYSSENLTYKTDVSEITGDTSVQNIRNIAETTVSAPVTNTADNPTAPPQTVINAGDSNYSYNSENLTYKTDVSEITGETSVQNIRNIAETTVSAPVTNAADNPTAVPQTVINAGDSNYSYSSENLTYKTDVSEIAGDTSVQNVRNIAETTVSAPVTNTADNPTAAPQTVINAGDSNYSYNSENLTYKTDVSEITGGKAAGTVPEARADSTPTLAETIADIGSEKLRKVSELPEISLLVMNSFLSGGTEYLSEVKNRYIHRHLSLSPVTVPEIGSAAVRLLNSPAASFGALSYAVSLIASEKELTPYERSIRDSAVTKVYAGRHSYTGFGAKQMLAGMGTQERTKVLSLIIKELAGSPSGISASSMQHHAENAQDPDITAAQTSVSAVPEHRTIRSVVKKFVDSIRKVSGNEKPDVTQPQKGAEKAAGAAYVPAVGKIAVTEAEMTLLRMLSEDKSGSIARAAGSAAERGGDTVSSQLGMLYHGIEGGRSTESIIAENIENAVYMPSVLNFYETARLTAPQVTENGHYTQNFPTDVRNTQITQNTFTGRHDLTAYRTDIRNINNIQTIASPAQEPHKTAARQDIYAASVMRDIREPIVADIHARGGQAAPAAADNNSFPRTAPHVSAVGRAALPGSVPVAAGGAGIPVPQGDYAGEPARASGTELPVFRKGLIYSETVRNALEKIAEFGRRSDAYGDRAGVRTAPIYANAAATPAVSSSGNERRTEERGAAGNMAAERGYHDTAQSFIFNTAVNEYSLPVTLVPDGKVPESVRLLPVYTLDGVILPRKLPKIRTNGEKALNRLSTPEKHTFSTLSHRMTILNDRKMLTNNSASGTPDSAGLSIAAENYTVPMDRMMQGETVLNYREPVAAAAAQPVAAAPAAVSQPSTSDLVRQFGNLIEGGDAGLVPSFDVGTRGISEAMAAIEQTAEKVEANSKLIEEIREKQRSIETVTLKSSDLDEISEEMIRRLRSRMRLDRSRYAGQ